ncbi:MAG: DNA primase [Gemmatimonadota bacterium]|nr:DNA primase [Gemmatimonadota bacterium]
MIPDDVVEEVRARADIVGVIGEFVQLRKAGREFRGLSPFKKEKTPSFYVIPAKAFFHDFSSGESGDVFSFLMKHRGMSFVDAVKHVGARSGVDVREVRTGRGRDDPWRPYHEASEYAASFFRERLWEWEGGEPARAYLEGRGIGREAGERFGLGYAPDEWGAFREAASVHGLDEGMLLELGLLKRSEKGGEPYDAFRNRVIFPIESVTGRVLAFGGRLLGEAGKGSPKYLNSPESPIFHKGEVLYGLSWARNRIRRDASVLVVEGFMDVVSLAAVEIRNVVAPLGTALTESHARLLKPYATQVRLLFDSDPAGQKATFRAADTLLREGLHPAVVTLPDGEDPDSVARSGGAKAVRGFVEQAMDVLDRKIAMLEERGYFESNLKRIRARDKLLPTLRAARDPSLRDIYVTRVAELTGVRTETLLEELKVAPAPLRGGRAGPPRRRRPAPRLHGHGEERTLLLLLVQDRGWIDKAVERVGPSDLEDAAYRVIFEALAADPELLAMPDDAMPEAVRRFERLMADPETLASPAQVFADAVARIEANRIDRRLEVIEREIRRAGTGEQVRLVRDKERLMQEKRALSDDGRRSARKLLALGRTREQGDDAE